jgi:lipopolysaccharide export system permease protein
MKIIDRFVLGSFLRPFFVAFIVMVLFLLMQFVWVYIDDLVGRGVEWYYIAELLFYASASVVPRALTLAVLLGSIMTFGAMGEHYELAAMKSSGLSLFRIMRPLLFFMVFVCSGAFMFSNYVIPVANFKSRSLLKNITNAKPALNIRQGVFYSGIEGYSIKIGEKFGEDNNQLRNIYIYDHTAAAGNLKVITAEQGFMQVSQDEQYLDINLYQGSSYEDRLPNERKDRDNFQFVKTKFDTALIKFNLSSFKNDNLRAGGSKGFDMLNINQLDLAVDSLKQAYATRKTEFSDQMTAKYIFNTLLNELDSLPEPVDIGAMAKEDKAVLPNGKTQSFEGVNDTILKNIKSENRTQVVQNALRIARSNKAYFDNTKQEFHWRSKLIARYMIEWQKKFSLSFTCLVLFFIGAPLGAIIRKGGMGMPVVVSIFIFLIYHVTSYSFEKLGRELVWSPFMAMWVANFYLLPFGIFLTYKSANDSAIFNTELYLKPFRKISDIFARLKRKS